MTKQACKIFVKCRTNLNLSLALPCLSYNLGLPWHYYNEGFQKNVQSPYCFQTNAPAQGRHYNMYLQTNGPTASIQYMTCDSISSVLATAAQFTIYAQTVMLFIFLFTMKVLKEGPAVVFERDTYLNLWQDEKVNTQQEIPDTIPDTVPQK